MGIRHIDDMRLSPPRHEYNLSSAVFRHCPELIDGIDIRLAVRLRSNLLGSWAGMGAVFGCAKNNGIAGMEFF